MTPLENEFLQQLGITYLSLIETLSISIPFYGASSSFVVYGPFTSLKKGAFVVLFSASVVIFMFVFSFLQVAYFLARPDSPRFHRRRGFSNRLIAAMFVMTVINFLLFSLYIGTQLVAFTTVYIRKALILDIYYPLSAKGKLVHDALQKLKFLVLWSANLPVRSNLSWITCLFTLDGGHLQRSSCDLEGLGPLPRSTAGDPHTIYAVDWNRR